MQPATFLLPQSGVIVKEKADFFETALCRGTFSLHRAVEAKHLLLLR